MELRKTIYFLLLIVIIIIFLSSISVNVSYSSNNTGSSINSVSNNNVQSGSTQQLPDSLYVNDMDNINKSNTVYAKIVGRPDVSVHKQLLSAENKFYSNRCN
jgi:flagellar basal body-associated protein FliL